MNAVSRWHFPLLLLLTCFFFLIRLDCPLLEPEEARYAEIPRQMLAEQAFIVPVLHGQPYLHKPPLLYWLVMTTYTIFGVHDWAARLIPGACGILIVLGSYLCLRRPLGAQATFLGALILCLCPRFLYLERMLTLDCLLCLWVVLSWFAGYRALEAVTFRWRWWLLSAGCCGLGLLTKGPVALALVLPPLVVWQWFRLRSSNARTGWFSLLLWERRRLSYSLPPCGGGLGWGGARTDEATDSSEFTPHPSPPPQGGRGLTTSCTDRFTVLPWLTWLSLAFAVALPWYLALAWYDSPALVEFLWLHNAVRFVAPFDHVKPFWFYLPSLLIGMLPWSLLLWPVGRSLLTKAVHPGQSFLLVAAGWCLFFFSAAGCKRPVYILPALPPLSFALGTYLASTPPWRRPSLWVSGIGVWAVLLGGGITWLLPLYHQRFSLREQVQPYRVLACDMPAFCYPKRWDSLGFYLQRPDVAVFEQEELGELLSILEQNPRSLVFVRKESLAELLAALPAQLQFVPQPRSGSRLRVGIVKRKGDP